MVDFASVAPLHGAVTNSETAGPLIPSIFHLTIRLHFGTETIIFSYDICGTS